jgi:hypothetical protein
MNAQQKGGKGAASSKREKECPWARGKMDKIPLEEDDDNDDDAVFDPVAAAAMALQDKKRARPLKEELYFWGPAIRCTTLWKCIEEDRPWELAMLIREGKEKVNVEHPEMTALTPLQHSVLLGRFKCTEVLIKAGARGAADILRRRIAFRAPTLASLIPGCTREELRELEYASPSLAIGPQLLSPKDFTEFKIWMQQSGCDSARYADAKHSLEELARDCGNWPAQYFLHKRAIYTFLACNRFGRGSLVARLPRDVAVYIARRFFCYARFCPWCRHAWPPGVYTPECSSGHPEVRLPCFHCTSEDKELFSADCSVCNQMYCRACVGYICMEHAGPRACDMAICNFCWGKGEAHRRCVDCQARVDRGRNDDGMRYSWDSSSAPPSDDDPWL